MPTKIEPAPVTLPAFRVVLRRWREGDHEPFAKMNADEEVMKYFPSMLTKEQSDKLIERIEAEFEECNFGLWAVECIHSNEFMGFVGIVRPKFEAHFTPCVEIGWRIAKKFWGHGYAPEAARVVLKDGFERCGLDEIVSMTTVTNKNSRRVMEKIGMTHDPADDFEHPSLPEGHPLRPHVLYRLTKAQWLSSP